MIPRMAGAARRWLVRLAFALQMAWHGVLAWPLRSVLTVLGVGIGVASVISLMAIGEGAREAVVQQFERLGSNVIVIKAEDPKVQLDPAEAATLVERVPSLEAATPILRKSLPVRWRWTRGSLPVLGVSAEYAQVRGLDLLSGRFFNDFHVSQRLHVAVLGYEVARGLLNGRDPTGHSLTVGGQEFRIMGVLAPRPGDPQEVDRSILIPYTLAEELMQRNDADEIWVKARSPEEAQLAVAQLGRIFRRQLGLDQSAPTPAGAPGPGGPAQGGGPVGAPPGALEVVPGGAAPVKPPAPPGGGAPQAGSPLPSGQELLSITNMNQMVQEADRANRVMTLLLGGMAAVSLLVGGLGIMNIMLVAVAERTGEIGLRRALGAKQGDLVAQFLLEALLLSAIGAVAGVAAGLWGSHLFTRYGFETVVTAQAVQVAVLVALGSGLVFGVYPALSAAALEPVEALRR
ncbi:MAG: ABC transporter permease [Bacillota bacterium]|nr:ABC transporter permease [Bacillota bacterium]